jgi:hypothetical protein
MHFRSYVFAAVATLALGALAPSAQATDSSLRIAQAGEAQGTSQAEGTKKEQLQGRGGSPTLNSPGPATTGTGVGGGTGGNAQRPGGTNNEQTGTQSHDAQKGGGGKDGAR